MKNTIKCRSLLLATLAGVVMATTCIAQEAKRGTSTPPPLAPLGSPPIPADNLQSPAKIEWGRYLFFDPRLGGDASTGCSTCHQPDQGWSWAEDISRGYPGTVHWRSNQTIINAAYYSKLFWAGSAKSLEQQAKSASKGGVAGNGETDIMEARMALIPKYVALNKKAFGTEWPLLFDAYRAIAAFERTLVQRDTPLDRYLLGDKSALSGEQIRGKQIFEGKGGCIQCHNGALASDENFYNIGVPGVKRWEEDGLAQITFRFELYAKGVTETLYRTLKDDPGAYFRSKNSWDMGKFRTPSLRYTVYTAPYMHSGQFDTLEEVVDFYNAGGIAADGRTTSFPQTKSPLIKPLGLTDEEKEALVAFIEAFSGDEIMIEKPELPPYAARFTRAELQAAQEAK